jgi:uncharacterized protein involved in exopolysaccharide biosynthesis
MTERREFEMPTQQGPDVVDEAVPVPWILAALLRGRRVIILLTAGGFVIALVVALLRMTLFTCTFSFIPQAGQDQSRNGLASLAGQFGLSVGTLTGQAQSPQLYADLLQTKEILMDVAKDTVVNATGQREPLSSFLGVHGGQSPAGLENTVRVLRSKVISASVAARTTGMVTVTTRTRSAQASLTIAEQLLQGLNHFNVETRRSQAGEERRFIESRLAAARESLRGAEDALQTFLQGNRQYDRSPELTFQQQRLERQVSLQQQVVSGLAQQYEDARIREVRDTPVITVLERPTVPVLPDPRGRATTVILGTAAAMFLGIAITLARAGWNRRRGDGTDDAAYEMLAREWRRVRGGSARA